jgi:hypothetical protein
MLRRIKEKKGVSIMVGYVLLITLAIVMGVIAYNWMKTYIPKEPTECQEGVSMIIQEAQFASSKLTLTMKNNGKFNIAGYLIYVSNSSEQELQTIDISSYLDETIGGKRAITTILFLGTSENSFKPNDVATHVFNIPAGMGQIYSVSLIPARIEVENNKERYVNCVNSRTEQLISS